VDLAIPSKGYGIKGMKERVESTGGEIMFESTPGAGMTIKVFMPIQNEE
jgi:signal transduction histidine kinase